MKKITNRNRKHYFFIITFIIIIGLLSRFYKNNLPDFIGNYGGDYLWGMMIFFTILFFFNKFPIIISGFAALMFAFIIELSQLYQADWINKIRQTLLGGLVLGFTFLWSDLICYILGIFTGMILEILMQILRKDIKI